MVQMTETRPMLKVVEPGAGDTGTLAPGVGVQFKIDAEDVGGRVSVVEHPFAVGALVPPHVHHREDEVSIVIARFVQPKGESAPAVEDSGGDDSASRAPA